MKNLVKFSLLLLPLSVSAQQEFNQADMQKMMAQAGAMQRCMSTIDQTAIEKISAEAEQVEQEVKTLCSAGKEEAARQRLLTFSQETLANKEIAKVRKCGMLMPGLVPSIPTAEEINSRPICEQN